MLFVKKIIDHAYAVNTFSPLRINLKLLKCKLFDKIINDMNYFYHVPFPEGTDVVNML